MELMSSTATMMRYIQSEAEFSRASRKGLWQSLLLRLLGRQPSLRGFEQALETLRPYCSVAVGVQDISTRQIVGSLGRSQNFTAGFWPAANSKNSQERWRTIYTLAVTGAGFPPIEVYKIGSDYFVKDGHHRVSVARYLGWPTVQARVTEVLAAGIDSGCRLRMVTGVKSCG